MSASKPVHEIRFGLIKGAIWRLNSRSGERHNVTICRLYKNGDTWTQSQHFGRDDLPLACKVLDLCHSWIFQQSQADAITQHEGQVT